MKHHSIIEKDLEDDKVVLTMNDHLYPGFTIWLTMLLIASIAFGAELARFHIRNSIWAMAIEITLKILGKHKMRH